MSEQPIYDVLGVGNAIVDVLAKIDDAFLADNDLPKGRMHLIDSAQADDLYDRMGVGVECSGGSAANTMAGIAAMGGKPAFIGKVKDDILGQVFKNDITKAGVTFNTPLADPKSESGTARCLVLVTPDAERTMNTYLGACRELSPEDVDPAFVAQAKVTYMEGYLWDEPKAKDAMIKAATAAHAAKRKVAFTLSDAFCVDRHRGEFLGLLDNAVDILFANEDEILSLYRVDTVQDAFAELRKTNTLGVITRGAQGSVVVGADDVLISVNAEKVEKVVDTTGAGDLFAAGFLTGYTQGCDLDVCARMGGIAAAEIISHYGARPAVDLAERVKNELS